MPPVRAGLDEAGEREEEIDSEIGVFDKRPGPLKAERIVEEMEDHNEESCASS